MGHETPRRGGISVELGRLKSFHGSTAHAKSDLQKSHHMQQADGLSPMPQVALATQVQVSLVLEARWY